MGEKIGFWTVLSIVFGSQIGSGIFILPSTLAGYGKFGLYGWCTAGLGAILIAMVFAELCSRFPSTGGPYVYVKKVFGRIPGFFIGWAYWLVSSVSNTVLVISSISYLSPFLGNETALQCLFFETLLVLAIAWINCRGVEFSGTMEFILSFIKFATFIIVPFILFPQFESSNIEMSEQYMSMSSLKLVDIVTIFCFWGFIGVECATTPAESVINPSKTIPLAIVLGTFGVAVIYLINSAAVMGVVPHGTLETSAAPFVDAIEAVVGKNTSLLMSFIASIVCIGTLNAWVLTSAQISLGLANDGLLPKMFGMKNKSGAPQNSVLVCCIGMIPILVMTMDKTLAAQISNIIDFSVKTFVVIYMCCTLALLKILISEKKIFKTFLAIIALLFCIQILLDGSVKSLFISSMFFISGVVMLPYFKKQSKQKEKFAELKN